MPQLGVAIFVVIIINGAFAFLQEYRAEKAAERLRDLLPRRATVIRNSRRIRIDAIDLVPDDMVVLTAGDRVSADLRLDVAMGLSGTPVLGQLIPDRPCKTITAVAVLQLVEASPPALVIGGRLTTLDVKYAAQNFITQRLGIAVPIRIRSVRENDGPLGGRRVDPHQRACVPGVTIGLRWQDRAGAGRGLCQIPSESAQTLAGHRRLRADSQRDGGGLQHSHAVELATFEQHSRESREIVRR